MALLLRGLVWTAALLTVCLLIFIVGYVLIRGIPHITPDLFAWEYTSENASLMPALINTLTLTLLTLAFAVPLGMGAAIYLAEYARRISRLVSLIRITTETLAGIPSIVYGLFGYMCFNLALRWRYTMLSGAITLGIMVLPTIIRTTEEALIACPDAYREGSFGLGAGRLRTIFHILLPEAFPGILSGVILAIGRIVGETAAVMFTAGTAPVVPASLMRSGRTLAVHMYMLLNEGLSMDKAYATAVILMVLVIGINLLSSGLTRWLGGKKNDDKI